MVYDRLSLKLELLRAADNDVQRYKKLYALVEDEAKELPAVMDTKEYIQAMVEGAGKIVKEMIDGEKIINNTESGVEDKKESEDKETANVDTAEAVDQAKK